MARNCQNCTEKCPQAEIAHNAALGRMYTTNEFIALQKKIDNGELVKLAHGEWIQVAIYEVCSHCGHQIKRGEEPRYIFLHENKHCRWCGAKMTGGD